MSGTLTSARNAYARARPFAVTILLGAAALTIALAGARAIADIVGPVFLALVLTISLHPIRIWLKRHRFPEWAASVILLLAAYLVLGLLTLALIVSVAQLAGLLPQYEAQLTAVVEDAGNTLRSLGVQQEQINAVVKAIDPGQLVAVAGAVLASTLGVLSNVFFLIVLLFFMVGGFHLVDGTAYLAASASIASGGGCGHGPRICSRLEPGQPVVLAAPGCRLALRTSRSGSRRRRG